MTSESTQPAAGETGKTDKAPKAKDPAPDLHNLVAMIAKLHAGLADLRADIAKVGVIASEAAAAAGEASAYMRVLLPEQYLALKPSEVLDLHRSSPSSRLKLTADFATNMVTLRRGEVLEAGDPRIPQYADRIQLALVVGGEDAGERVAALVEQANARHVAAAVENRRREMSAAAAELAAKAREAAEHAERLARGN